MGRPPATAGRSTRELYNRMRAEWLRTLRPVRFALVVVAGVLLFLASGRDFASVLIGMLLSAVVCLYLVMRDSPPADIERYLRGAQAEERTATELEPLRDQGFIVRHDLDATWGNWDHVVVGPTGVFVIDTKSFGGLATVSGDGITVERPGSRRGYRVALRRRLQRQAVDLKSQIEASTGRAVWVQPVVCLWSDFEGDAVERGGVAYVHGRKLREWITGRPTTLSAPRFRAVVGFLEARRR